MSQSSVPVRRASARSAQQAPPKRHRWVKLETHLYVCRDCATGRENKETQPGWWETTYSLPDGTSKVSKTVPACQVGQLTTMLLELFAVPIAAWKGHRHAIDMRPAASAEAVQP